MPIITLYDRQDAMRYLATRPPGRAFLALTPSARAPLLEAGIGFLDPRTRFGDLAQARIVVRVARARRRLIRALEQLPGHRPTIREIIVDQFNRVAFSSWRLWETLGPDGPWLVPSEGTWHRCAQREEAHRRLLSHILGPKVARERVHATLRPPPLGPVYRMLRRFVLLRRSPASAVVVTGVYKEQFGLFKTLRQGSEPARIIVLRLAKTGWREYLRLARELARARRSSGLVQLAVLPRSDGAGSAVVDAALGSLNDPVIAPALEHYRGLLMHKLDHVAEAFRDLLGMLDTARPDIFSAAEVSTIDNWLLAEACGARGVQRVVFSFNAHAPTRSPIAADSTNGYLRARYPEGLVDEHLFWSPLGARTARQTLPQQSSIRAIAAVPVWPLASEPRDTERLVLVADTYAVWWFPQNWVFQTSDEFVDGVRALDRAVGQLSSTRLLVRAKRKPECDLATLIRLVEPSPRCEIKIRDVPFAEDLAAADLVVTFRSTTIEEALRARKPVLLWGGTGRYRYVPARVAPPTPADRAAVYAVDRVEDLAPMIDAILRVHGDRPLTDSELVDYVWPSGTPDIATFAASLAGREPMRPWQEKEPQSDAA